VWILTEVETKETEEEEKEEEADWVDLEAWVIDLKAKYTEMEEQETLTQKEQSDFNEKLMDVMLSIIVNMRIQSEALKTFQTVYKIRKMTTLIDKLMGVVENSDNVEEEDRPEFYG